MQTTQIVTASSESTLYLSHQILSKVMEYRRYPKDSSICKEAACQSCASVHLPKIIESIREGKPIVFVLPAFPGKSPNTEKVLGRLPDHAEALSLVFLDNLCNEIEDLYAPGAQIILCSDGRVFSDAVGIRESDVSAYQKELTNIIGELGLSNLATFNLDDFYHDMSFNQMREELMKSYGQSLDFLKNKISRGSLDCAEPNEVEALRMYCGITRFLFEDSLLPGQTKSRSNLQKEARIKAYEVIRRSNAWSELIEEHFPEAVRLSIHPQTCGSKKLGIRLIADESWMTPWHGVALQTDNGFQLIRKDEAEKLGAHLVFTQSGKPSHYQLLGRKIANLEQLNAI